MNPGFFRIGKVLKVSGSTGELILSFETDVISDPSSMESVFLSIHGNLIPFFFESLRIRNRNQALVKFLDTDTAEDAELLIGCNIFLPDNQRPGKKRGSRLDADLSGFILQDTRQATVGTISGILELPMQELLQVDYQGRIILVPVVEDWIQSIDTRKKTLIVTLPEGLLDL